MSVNLCNCAALSDVCLLPKTNTTLTVNDFSLIYHALDIVLSDYDDDEPYHHKMQRRVEKLRIKLMKIQHKTS